MSEDTDLLRRYAESKSEAAFSELVRRRVGLVYSIALRKTHDAHRAEDVAQVVFTTLARNAESLSQRTVLIGWFYKTAHNAAIDIVRSEISRNAREQEAQAMQEISVPADPVTDWDNVRPILDEVLNELDEDDRNAVLLRFFDDSKYIEIGRALQIPENTARMRVERALDRLHGLLTRRGIASTGAALASALSQQGMAGVPSGLVASIMQAALPATAVATGIQAALLRSVLTPKAIGTGAVIVAALSFAVIGLRRHEPESLAASSAKSMALQSVGQNTVAPTPVAGAFAAPGSPVKVHPVELIPPPVMTAVSTPAPPESQLTPQQRSAIRNNLSMISAARDFFLKLNKRLPDNLEDIVGEQGSIRELKPVDGEDYHSVKMDAKILAVQMPDGSSVTYTTEGPAPKGPPTLAEAAEWRDTLSSYIQLRPPGRDPRMPVKSSDEASASKGPRFVGMMAASAGPVFVLADETGVTQWLKIGQKYGPYLIKDYRADEETLLLVANDRPLALKLQTGKVISSFTAETEIAYLAWQEVAAREGWAFSMVSIQKPDYVKVSGGKTGAWFDVIHQILEKDDRHMVMGDAVVVFFDENGKLESYKILGPRKPNGK